MMTLANDVLLMSIEALTSSQPGATLASAASAVTLTLWFCLLYATHSPAVPPLGALASIFLSWAEQIVGSLRSSWIWTWLVREPSAQPVTQHATLSPL